jgi:hypothetical protein
VESATDGELSIIQMGAAMTEIGEKIASTAKAHARIPTVTGTKAIGLMVKLLGRESSFMPMATSTKVNFAMEKCTAKALTFIPLAIATMGNGKTTSATEEEPSFSWDQTTL